MVKKVTFPWWEDFQVSHVKCHLFFMLIFQIIIITYISFNPSKKKHITSLKKGLNMFLVSIKLGPFKFSLYLILIGF